MEAAENVCAETGKGSKNRVTIKTKIEVEVEVEVELRNIG